MSIASGRRQNSRSVLPYSLLFILSIGLLSGLWPGSTALGAPIQGPPSPRPAFYLIERWESAAQAPKSGNRPIDATALAVNRLCRFYGLTFDPKSPLMASPSPLEWPRVFADQAVNPRRLRTDLEALMQRNGLAFRELVTLENNDTADSIMSALSFGEPVLLNFPSAPILYGYDRREPDMWWWVQRPRATEIMFESERAESLMYWTDDPASNLAWAVTGPDSTQTPQTIRDRQAAYDWLRTIIESVRDDPSRGVKPYPLSVRAFRDRVANRSRVPKLAEPVDANDPLGIRRARDARLQLVELLEWLSTTTTDPQETEPLRLALYYYHHAVGSLDHLDTLLYDGKPGPVNPATYEAKWEYDVQKVEIVHEFENLLEWEKQAAGEIGEAVSIVTPAKKKRK